MARLKHSKSGAVVEVADEKVSRMGSEWEPVKVEQKAPAKKAVARKSEK